MIDKNNKVEYNRMRSIDKVQSIQKQVKSDLKVVEEMVVYIHFDGTKINEAIKLIDKGIEDLKLALTNAEIKAVTVSDKPIESSVEEEKNESK